MVRLDLVQRTMERETETNVVFLDACRDNPLARNLARTMGTRSAEIGRGLAATEAGVGTLISFSTQPGNVALDGAGRNSPFAAALVRRILASSDDLSALLIDVRNEVRKETQNKQVPWEHSALTGRFYFNPSAQRASTTVAAPARLSEAAEAWDRAKDTTDAAVLEAFIARFKDTFYANLARARFEELRKRRVAAATPDPSPMQSTKDLYDGSWLARAVSNCRNLPTWANRFTITGSKIQGETYNGKISGRVAADGSFRYTVPGFGSPNIFGTFTGKLHDDAGTGTLKYPNCTGSITLSRM
jgi:Caspase domain